MMKRIRGFFKECDSGIPTCSNTAIRDRYLGAIACSLRVSMPAVLFRIRIYTGLQGHEIVLARAVIDKVKTSAINQKVLFCSRHSAR